MIDPACHLEMSELLELDKRSHLHPFTMLSDHQKNGPLMMVRGQGTRLQTMPAESISTLLLACGVSTLAMDASPLPMLWLIRSSNYPTIIRS